MEYIDTGDRNPANSVAAWLAAVDPHTVSEFRMQSGFFSADALGYIATILEAVTASNGIVRILIGSNDGTTQSQDVELLLDLVGPPRQNLSIGIVRFSNAYFHPKVLHLVRSTGSGAAYVGSANFTSSGVGSRHVEAGLILDSSHGDSPKTLIEIMAAVDRWFEPTAPRPGFNDVEPSRDLEDLVTRRIIGVPRPRSAHEDQVASTPRAAAIPGLDLLSPPPTTPKLTRPKTSVTPSTGTAAVVIRPLTVKEKWTKTLSASDAQRKGHGNQRGSITLVKSTWPIDASTYFRTILFDGANWIIGTTATGQPVEDARIPMLVSINGTNLGELTMHVSHAPNRNSNEHNYESLLHLGPLSAYFRDFDLTDHLLTIERRDDDSFSLTIAVPH